MQTILSFGVNSIDCVTSMLLAVPLIYGSIGDILLIALISSQMDGKWMGTDFIIFFIFLSYFAHI